FSDKTKLNVGINTAIENRIGGDIHFIQGKGDTIHSYFEENKTQRYSTQLSFDHKCNDKSFFNFKNSVSYFNRIINITNYRLDVTQTATFSEASYTNIRDITGMGAGVNLCADKMQKKQTDTFPLRKYNQITFGAFAQNSGKAN